MDSLNNWEGKIRKFMIIVLGTIFAVHSVSAGGNIDYDWNGTHLIVNVTSPQGVGSAQMKLNISSDLTIGSATLTGFMTGATHMQSGTEHRWFQLGANGNSNGVLEVPIACSTTTGSYETKLINVNIKNNSGDSIPLDTAVPISQTINCGTQGTSPVIWSSDSNGNEKNAFDLTEIVYVTGKNFTENDDVCIYVVNDLNWNDGDILSDVSADGHNEATTNNTGHLPATDVWNTSLVIGDYDVVVDVDCDEHYNASRDAVDNMSVDETGFYITPEPIAIILFITGLSMLYGLIRLKREK